MEANGPVQSHPPDSVKPQGVAVRDGLVLYAAARFRQCAEACREAIPLLERTGDCWQVHIARFQYSCALYRLGDMAEALEQAKLQHYSGIEVGDEQAAGISLDIWARATCGAVPQHVLDAELQRKRSDTQGTVHVLFAQGVQLYYAGQNRRGGQLSGPR